MGSSALAAAEKKFLRALDALGVRFMLVGMSAALLQGARGATDDLDLWFENLSDPRIAQAAERAGGIYISGTFGLRPPQIGGDALGDRFDVVTHLDGLGSFADEWKNTRVVDLEGLAIRALLLSRIALSKRTAGRPKDLAQIPALEEAMALVSRRPRTKRRRPKKQRRKR
jgi:hypothetical protein